MARSARICITFSAWTATMERQLFDLCTVADVITNPTGTLGFRYIGYLAEGEHHRLYLQTSHMNFRLTPAKVVKDLRRLQLYESCIVSVVAVGRFPAVSKSLGLVSDRGKRARRFTWESLGKKFACQQ